MAKAAAAAPFIKKTYKLVDDAATDDVISWGDDGKSFVVRNPADFTAKLLPSSFKHNNFSSFIRQLNTYGFRKAVPDKWEFANENFRKGQPELLLQIRRRKNGAPLATPPSSESSTSSPATSNSSGQRPELSDENEKLKEANIMLSKELAEAKRQYLDLMAIMTSKNFKADVDAVDNNLRKKLKIGAEDGDDFKLFGVWLKGRHNNGDQDQHLVNM